MSAYPFASSAKVEETLDVLGTRNIATTQQTLLQQFLVACAVSGGAPAPTPPATPSGFTATPGNQFTTLSWDAQPEADTFTIFYSLTNVFGSAIGLTSAATGTEFTHSAGEGIQVGERYYYWIQAVNNVGASSFTTPGVAARSFVTLANGANINLVTPTGSWILSTLFFGTGGNLPPNCLVYWDGALQGGLSLGDGTWEDIINGGIFDPAISGAFNFENQSGSSVTFWDTEPPP